MTQDLSEMELSFKRAAERLCIAEVKAEDSAHHHHYIDDLLTQMNGDWEDSDEAEVFYALVNWREDVMVTEEDDPEPEDLQEAVMLSVFCGSGRSLKLYVRNASSLAQQIYINTPLRINQPKGTRKDIREIQVL